MSPQKISAITLCATAIGVLGCRDPFADCLPGFVELEDGNCGKAEASTSDTDPTTSGMPPVCGNSVVEQGEECEPPDSGGYGKCKDNCRLDRHCGDSVPDPEEQCDDGKNLNQDDGCTDECKTPVCGDGFIQKSLAETCDDGATANADDAACTTMCKNAVCGDGHIQTGVEECDDGGSGPGNGPGKACNLGCHKNVCGDGDQSPAEQCDDGNTTPGDGCSAMCYSETCGNTKMDAGEECDDGKDGDQNNECTDACKHPTCGDGWVNKAGEECDDGNMNDGDNCTKECRLPKCGNSIREGIEECDDGNTVDGDQCSKDCLYQSRVVFATSDTYTGALGGVTGADGKCAIAAGNKFNTPPGGQWLAWLSDGTTSPSLRFDRFFRGSYLRPGLAPNEVAKGWADLTDGSLLNSISVDENGSSENDQSLTWTNTLSTGDAPMMGGENCSNWNMTSLKGRVGNTTAKTIFWTAANLQPLDCTTALRLYCFQDVPSRVVFVTSAIFGGNLGGLTGADMTCDAAAKTADPPLSGSWKAWLSDDMVSPLTNDRFDTNFTGWYRLPDGTPVARGWAELTDGAVRIDLDENGKSVMGSQRAWSNTKSSGTKASDNHCNGWADGTTAFKGRFGNFKETSQFWSDDEWVSSNPADCSEQYHLYCIQDGP